MTTYTGVADENGDFTIPFSSSYASGEKITVTAEKDASTKSIELFAPSEFGAIMHFSGSLVDFPKDVGDVTINMSGKLQEYAFSCVSPSTIYNKMLARSATSISLPGCTELGENAFEFSNVLIQKILSSPSLVVIGDYAFKGVLRSQHVNIPSGKTWGYYVFSGARISSATFESGFTDIPAGIFYQCSLLTSVIIPASVANIRTLAFRNCGELNEITVFATTPPAIVADALQGIKSTCIIKVPSTSLAAYQAATNWSAHASRMIGI